MTMLRMAISDTRAFGWNDPISRLAGLALWARQCIAAGVDLLQLREKHLDAGELTTLAAALLRELPPGGPTRLLVNGRADVALATGAAGVQLTAAAGELRPEQVRTLFLRAGRPAPLVSVSCHSLDDVRRAKQNSAGLLLFGPVFGKQLGGAEALPGVGLERLRAARAEAGPVPVLALGGVTPGDLPACLATGAAGFAAIRAFAPASGQANNG